MASKLFPCPCCKGEKVQHLTAVTVTAEGRSTEHRDIPCIWCKGEGVVEAKVLREHQFYTTLWCECEPPPKKTVFFDDGEHPEISKHHYRCYFCQKVTQIG